MIIHLKLPTLKQNEHPEYEDVEKFINMGNWFVDEVDKKTKIKIFNVVSGIKLYITEIYLCQFWRVCCKNMWKHFVLLPCIH